MGGGAVVEANGSGSGVPAMASDGTAMASHRTAMAATRSSVASAHPPGRGDAGR